MHWPRKEFWMGVATVIMTTAAFIEILKYKGIGSFDELYTAVRVPHGTGLIFALLMYAFGIGLATYSIAVSYKISAQHKSELANQQQTYEEAKQRIKGDYSSEISRAVQIRNIAIDESRVLKEENLKLRHELEETKKCFYCPPEDLPITVEPTWGPSDRQYLIVTNKGPAQKFRAQCIVLNPTGSKKNAFALAWDSGLISVSLASEEEGRLRIAKAWSDHYGLCHIGLCEATQVLPQIPEWPVIESFQWDATDRNPGLQYRIQVKIFGDNAGVHCEEFIVRPGKSEAIQIVKAGQKTIPHGSG